MPKDNHKTKTIFRVFPDGSVIAIFPEIKSAKDYIGSYQHIGQHGDCSLELIEELKPATKEEYIDLLEELTNMGYNIEYELDSRIE